MKIFVIIATSLVALASLTFFMLPKFISLSCSYPKVCMDFRNLKTSLDAYYLDHGQYPRNLPALIKNSKRPLIDRIPLDVWENNYLYLSTGEYSSKDSYIILTLGADGLLGGQGADEDMASNGTFCEKY